MATMIYYKQGYVNWKFAIIIAIKFLVGGFLGGKIVLKVNLNLIRKIFGILLPIVSIKFIIRKIRTKNILFFPKIVNSCT